MIYNNKHVVFEQVGTEYSGITWNLQNNTDGDGCLNNYEISNVRNVILNQTIIGYLSNDLTSELVSTTVQTAKNGKSSILVSTTDKLFIPASKEVGYTTYSISAENNVLTTWQYWTTHSTSTDHIKKDFYSQVRYWWLRSPYNNSSGSVIYINGNGDASYDSAKTNYQRISSCFAW